MIGNNWIEKMVVKNMMVKKHLDKVMKHEKNSIKKIKDNGLYY